MQNIIAIKTETGITLLLSFCLFSECIKFYDDKKLRICPKV
jgi:hypothetical protein